MFITTTALLFQLQFVGEAEAFNCSKLLPNNNKKLQGSNRLLLPKHHHSFRNQELFGVKKIRSFLGAIEEEVIEGENIEKADAVLFLPPTPLTSGHSRRCCSSASLYSFSVLWNSASPSNESTSTPHVEVVLRPLRPLRSVITPLKFTDVEAFRINVFQEW